MKHQTKATGKRHPQPTSWSTMSKSAYVVLFALLSVVSSQIVAAESASLLNVDINVSDTAALQRGVRTFNDYCLGCHGADYMRYKRIASDLNINEGQIEARLLPPGREMTDALKSSLQPEAAKQLFGAVPPNLSLSARARGADWLYTYMLTFYRDDSTASGWNNLTFPNAAMPHAMWDLQGVQELAQHAESTTATDTQAHGHADITAGLELIEPGLQSPEDYRRTVKDLVTFMVYLSEPAQLQRSAMGPWVLLFLVLFTLLAWILKREYWRDVH